MVGFFSMVYLTAKTTKLCIGRLVILSKVIILLENSCVFCITESFYYYYFCIIMKYNNEIKNKNFKVRESTRVMTL